MAGTLLVPKSWTMSEGKLTFGIPSGLVWQNLSQLGRQSNLEAGQLCYAPAQRINL
jgi:hypothetical protein